MIPTKTTPPPTTSYAGFLAPQTGMPPNVVHRSKELMYDALDQELKFIFNPYGPRLITLSRPNQHW